MSKVVSIKEFRNNLSYFADMVDQGDTVIVIRRSVPAFKITPVESIEADDKWEELVDFTNGGKKKGISAKKLLKKMLDFEKNHG